MILAMPETSPVARGEATRATRGAISGVRVAAVALLLVLASASSSASQDSESPGRRGGERWGASYFPNVTLTTHEGESVRFFDDLIEGKVVVINFIYTTCPDVCPLETAKLAELQAILGDRVGRDVFMYSITIDPDTDTPEVLAEYARRYQVSPGWSFLTGAEEDIILLRKKLGLYIDEIQDEDSNDHNLSLIIGNQSTGRWMKRSPFESSYFLADQVGSWLHNWKTPSANQDSYANAPERLRALPTGERLFSTRCATCHLIGGRSLAPYQSGKTLGPDLLGVTQRREREWLTRWLIEPNEMLAEKDPLAMELFEKHDRVAMPNMALNQQDVEALLEYLEVESRRAETLLQLADANVDVTGEAPSECCQKGESPVVQSGESTSEAASRRGPDRPRSRRFSNLLTYGSIGLAGIFLSLALFVRRYAESSNEGQHAAPRGSTGQPAQSSSEQEANR